jgi:hypothetical protein
MEPGGVPISRPSRPDLATTRDRKFPLMHDSAPKRTGRVSPLWRGTSDLNFPGNLLRRHHCSLNSDGTGSGSLSRIIARSTVMPFRRTTSQPRSSLSMARSTWLSPGALLQLKVGQHRADVLSSLSRGFKPINFPLFYRLDAVRCACSSHLFAERVSMCRRQPAATCGLVSGRSGLYCQCY